MELKDEFFLQELRKSRVFGSSDLIPDSVWEQIEKQVGEVGVLGLTGVAKQIVLDLVLKHGEPGKSPDYGRMHPDGKGGSKGTGSGGKKQTRSIRGVEWNEDQRKELKDRYGMKSKSFDTDDQFELDHKVADNIAKRMKSTTAELENASFVSLNYEESETDASEWDIDTIITWEGKKVKTSSPEGDAAIRRQSVVQLMEYWNESSDLSNVSTALQDVAKKEFDLKGTSRVNSADSAEERREFVKDFGPVYSDFLRAQYAETQEMLERRGIKEITAYRGFTAKDTKLSARIKNSDDNSPVPTDTKTRPLSSWSTSRSIAEDFASRPKENNESGVVFEATISASQIMSTPVSGMGVFSEGEIVTVGAAFETTTYLFEASYDSMDKAVDSSSSDVIDLDEDSRNADWIKSFGKK